jgi:hypothetical protein
MVHAKQTFLDCFLKILDKKRKKWRELDQYAIFNTKWPQQKQFSPTFRNIVFCEAKASKGKKNDILEN